MLIKPINQLSKGKIDAYKQTYTGEVLDNNDPDKLKRIKVNIPLWDMYTDDQLQWVAPESSSSSSPDVDNHNIPEVGSTVKVFFENGNPENPRYTGAGVTEDTKCSLYDESYPNTYGEKDSIGNFTMHNKETGVSVYHHNSGTEIQMDPDGSYLISNKTGAYVACDASGEFRISGTKMVIIADDEIDISATRVNIAATNLLNLKGGYVEITGEQKLDCNAPYVNIYGALCNLASTEVKVVKSFSVESACNWTFTDPIGKKQLDFTKGILVASVPL